MSATIEIVGDRFTIDGWKWTGPRPALVDFLNAMLDPEGPSGADPAPDVHEAERALEVLGVGELVEFDVPEYDPEAVY